MLEDGKTFIGENFGSSGEVMGEVVFNTSMTGYQEILTDPSYHEQIVTMTYPQIGNYGVNSKDVESKKVQAFGLIVREYFEFYSNPTTAYIRFSPTDEIAQHSNISGSGGILK